jgi:single-stranded DNA-binding protein
MISALCSGELIADPQQRATKDGAPYATATVRVPAGAEALFIGLSAFDAEAVARLMRLRKGSAVAAAGTLEVTTWTGKDGAERRGWRLTASEVLSVHQARRKRDDDRRERTEGEADSRSVARLWREEQERTEGRE